MKIRDQIVTKFDFADVLLKFFLLFSFFIFLFILFVSLFSLDLIGFSAFNFHLPFNPINVVLLFPISLFGEIELIPQFVVLSLNFVYFLFSLIESQLLGIFPFLPLLIVFFFNFKFFFSLAIKIFFEAINSIILFIKNIKDFFTFFFKRFFLFFQFLDFMIKFFFSFICFFNFVLNVSDTFSIFNFSF